MVDSGCLFTTRAFFGGDLEKTSLVATNYIELTLTSDGTSPMTPTNNIGRDMLHKKFTLGLLAFSLLTACGVPAMIENTVELADGHKIHVALSEASPSESKTQLIANMLLMKAAGPVTGRKPAFIEAAELKSGCVAIEETFLFVSSGAAVAAVELEC